MFSNIQFPIYLLLLFFPPISRISILSVQIDLGILESPPRDLETRKINNAVEVAAIVLCFFLGGELLLSHVVKNFNSSWVDLQKPFRVLGILSAMGNLPTQYLCDSLQN